MSDDRLASLISALNSPKLRENAIIDLGDMRDVRAVEPLSRMLVTQDNSHAFAYRPRKLSAEALGKIGDAHALPALLLGIEDIHPLVRQAVAEALGKLRDPQALNPLMTLLKDESKEVRLSATVALGELGRTTEIPVKPFLDLLADSSDEIRILGKQIFLALSASGVDALIEGLKHPNSTIRGACADILAELKAEKAYQALLQVATNDNSKWVKSRAQSALSVLPKPEFEYPTVKRNTIPPPSDTLERIRDQKADWSNLRSRGKLPPLPPIPTTPQPPPQKPVELIDPEKMTADEIRELLDQLDMRLANGEISELTHQRLHARWEKRLNEKS